MSGIIINSEEIRSLIHGKHEEFINGCGDISMEISANDKLILEIARARLNYILGIFVEEGIIDSFKDVSVLESHMDLSLLKKGFTNSISVMTDGSILVFKDSNFEISSTLEVPFKVRFDDVWEESFDWVAFSSELLGFIHTVIYERKRASEVKILGNLQRK